MSTEPINLSESPQWRERKMAELGAQWQGLHKEHDSTKAGLLAEYESQDFSQREIAKAVGKGQSTVDHLLRYGRFLSLTPIGVKITEGKFRAYWVETSDPLLIETDKWENDTPQEKKTKYEVKIFTIIAQKIKDGKDPIKTPRKQPKTKVEFIRGSKGAVVELKKELRTQFRKEVLPTLETLRSLMRTDRARYSPDTLASTARMLEEGIKKWLSTIDLVLDKGGKTETPKLPKTGS